MSNNWKGVSWRRKGPESSVSVNARLARLSSNDLLDLAESSLITAGAELLHGRGIGRDLSLVDFHFERAKLAAKTAYEALEIITAKEQHLS